MNWGKLIRDSIVRPRTAARRLLDAGLPGGVLLQAAVAVICVSMVIGYAGYYAVGVAADTGSAVAALILTNPLVGAAVQLVMMAVTVVLTVRIGRLFGGQGNATGALAVVVWLNALMVLSQIGQLVLLMLVPVLSAALTSATLVWVVWAFACFVAELHGFRRPIVVLGAILAASVVIFLGTAMLLAILGITPQEIS